MDTISGLGKLDRERLGALIQRTKGTISVSDAADILKVSPTDSAKMLARWRKAGWVSRIRRGIYVPVPLESPTGDVPLEDAWVIAERLFAPCYIGGWSAAEHWGLTEQIFRTILVMTTQKPRDRSPNIKGTKFLLRTILERAIFGLKPIWRGQVKVSVSDPTRTVLDMLDDPKLGGGIRSTIDVFLSYLKSEQKDTKLLVEYAKRLDNGAVFKRLGFLAERFAPEERYVIQECQSKITQGNAKIDSALAANKLITKWRLWVPDGWVTGEPK